MNKPVVSSQNSIITKFENSIFNLKTSVRMNRSFNKASSHKEAEMWDILQQIKMTPRERQKVASELKKKYYGKNAPDVRESVK